MTQKMADSQVSTGRVERFNGPADAAMFEAGQAGRNRVRRSLPPG